MIPQQIIEKAIEGGWDNQKAKDFDNYGFWEMIALNPLFWQALGKTLRWKSECDDDKAYPYRCYIGWLYHWHRFIDCLAEGADTDTFWDELLQDKQ